ncbi:MAG TPA: hypothetical protein ENJ09_00560, partial [Planctomycetes bacterium]|nr:hypothetical protein [Planctomycetota bacterium]
MKIQRILLLAALAAIPTQAQGSGTQLTLSGPAILGQDLTFDAQLTAPGPAVLLFDTQLGPVQVSGYQLDVALSSSFFYRYMPTTGTTQTSLTVHLPNDPSL